MQFEIPSVENIDIKYSDSVLSTITCESKISNLHYTKEHLMIISLLVSVNVNIYDYEIKYGGDEKTTFDLITFNTDKGIIRIPNWESEDSDDLAKKWINMINQGYLKNENNKNEEITDDILLIGCNYGEFITNEYIELKKPKKKSNRGRKKKVKEPSKRKKIGNCRYFNSQITFTMKLNNGTDKFYHIKLFTNGTLQIPYIAHEDLSIAKPYIYKIMRIINYYKDIKIDNEKEFEIIYIKSIMRNYKFHILNSELKIDISKFRSLIIDFKKYMNTFDADQDISNILEEYKNDWDILSKRKIALIKHSSERYGGFILKFQSPPPNEGLKNTTVKIFSSGKFNIDGCLEREESDIIKSILETFIKIKKNELVYIKL